MYFQRLRDLREDKDMSQSEIAELLFTSQTVYSRYERGVRTILVSICLFLPIFTGFPPTTFWEGQTKKADKIPLYRAFCTAVWFFICRFQIFLFLP